MRLHLHTPPAYHPGLGTVQQITAGAGSAASTAGTIAVVLAGAGGPVGALVGASIAAATEIAIAIENRFSGCGQTCVQASNIANQVGALLQQNLDKYLSNPVRYQSMQAAALQTFDAAWAQLVQACSNPALQAAGQRCISDRQAGSCHWHTSPGGWSQDTSDSWTYTAPGPDGSGSTCWNWFVGLRDPIANDPAVQPDPPEVSAALAAFGVTPAGSSTGFLIPLLILAGMAFFLVRK